MEEALTAFALMFERMAAGGAKSLALALGTGLGPTRVARKCQYLSRVSSFPGLRAGGVGAANPPELAAVPSLLPRA